MAFAFTMARFCRERFLSFSRRAGKLCMRMVSRAFYGHALNKTIYGNGQTAGNIYGVENSEEIYIMLWPCEVKRGKAREIGVGELCSPLRGNPKAKPLYI